MLQEHTRLFQRLMFVGDVVFAVVAWILAYYIRFELLVPPEWVPFEQYLFLLPWVLIVASLVFWATGLYAPDIAQRLPTLVLAVAKAVAFELIVVAASLSFYRTLSFSRLMLILFGVITPFLMVSFRLAIYAYVRRARRQGKYVRRVLIVGAGRVGRRLKRAFEQFPWMGLRVVGFADEQQTGPDVLGGSDDVVRIVDESLDKGEPIDYVYIALPLTAARLIEKIIEDMSSRLAHVCLVPDLFEFDVLNSRVTHIGGLPVIHVIDEAPIEFGRFLKRAVDIAVSLGVLIVASPLLLILAVAVKVSSPGPVFYKQERMGLNGLRFNMLKFRSMPVNVEEETGPVWAKPGEKRATGIGAFMRRTSLDELPQFINVLKGDMSVVGPRPERPVFIDEFKDRIPRYMLRHMTKAGITGWAQVHGWRGDTSLEKRIEYDLYYIQNWSLTMDLKIMWMTLWSGFVSENAY
ncbi:MAG: undecaprenyl-phosphate glucose phosphotransferase [Rhodothermales bacterium]|nr:undecaprenyl-phosphate glucose phosphotransferase [Rhodothermales bacterium]